MRGSGCSGGRRRLRGELGHVLVRVGVQLAPLFWGHRERRVHAARQLLGVVRVDPHAAGAQRLRCMRSACAVHAQCVCGGCAVRVRCMRSACAVDAQCVCGACEVRVRCMRSTCAVHVRCLCGASACAVHVQCMCSACAVHVPARPLRTPRAPAPPWRRPGTRRTRTRRGSCLQPHRVAASRTYGCSLPYLRLQPIVPTVAASTAHGCSLPCLRL